MPTVNNKKISIIIPLYNQADKIINCLNSIKNQTLQSYEVIVVNDGSTDHPEENIKKLSLSNMQIINQENQGSNPARNKGFKESVGEYLLFCDADIVLKPCMLENMASILEKNHNISYVYSSFYWGSKLFKLFEFSSAKLKQMPFIHTTSLIRRGDFPGFDNNIKRLQDWDLWLTMLSKNKTGQWISDPLFHVETGGTISTWMPKIFYKLFPFLPQVKKYNQAVQTIKKKHNLV